MTSQAYKFSSFGLFSANTWSDSILKTEIQVYLR